MRGMIRICMEKSESVSDMWVEKMSGYEEKYEAALQNSDS